MNKRKARFGPRANGAEGMLSRRAAFTLMEVVVAVVITGVVFGGILAGYVQSARRIEWSAYSLAAEGLNIQQVEQIRAAKWDTQTTSTNSVDETSSLALTNWAFASGKWTGYMPAILDVPCNASNGNVVWATNFVSLSVITNTANSLATVKLIQSDTVWSFRGKRYTNSIAAYRAPDQ